MDVHHNVAAGYLSTSRCESPDVVIHCGLCFRSSDCCAGSSFPKISMGSRIPCNRSTLQSGCTHCSFWKGRSLAEWGWSRSVPDGRNCAKSRTPPHSVIDNKPVATTQISLKHCQLEKCPRRSFTSTESTSHTSCPARKRPASRLPFGLGNGRRQV